MRQHAHAQSNVSPVAPPGVDAMLSYVHRVAASAADRLVRVEWHGRLATAYLASGREVDLLVSCERVRGGTEVSIDAYSDDARDEHWVREHEGELYRDHDAWRERSW